MAKDDATDDIRKKALELLRQRGKSLEDIDLRDASKLLNELQIHQIELELQNDELRRVQHELEEAVRTYNNLYDFAPIGYLTLDRHMVITEINLTAARQLGAERAALVGRHFTHFILPASQDTFYFHCRETLVKKSRTACEITLRRQDGAVFTAQIESAAVLEGAHPVTSIRSAVIDISDRKRAEEFSRHILESVDESFMVIDRDYRIVTANRAFSELVKLPLADIVGKHCYRVSHHRDTPCFRGSEECAVRHTFLTGEPKTVLHVHYDADKRPLYIETKSFPLRDESGEVVNVIEVLHNVTERRRLEEQLHHAQKMEAVGLLAGGIAHDFNNILSAIMASAHILKDQSGGAAAAAPFIEEIILAAERAGNLTNSLLAFSRKQISHPKHISLNDVVHKIEKLLARVIGADIELRLDLHPDQLMVLADPYQIEQVVMNLAINARDAMPGGGRLTIGLRKMRLDKEFLSGWGRDQEGDYVLLTLADTGVGMDAAVQERIFEPFFTTKEQGRGTGLGLSIAYGIVNQHRGIITVQSRPGKGAVFSIYLPLTEEKKAAKTPAAPAAAYRGAEVILLAEDNEAVRRLTKTVLEGAGYTVLAAVDGEDAVRLYDKHADDVDLLFLDIIMPKLDGMEVYTRIKERRPSLRTVFSSGYTADVLEGKGLSGEELNFLKKPSSPIEILKKVRETLDAE